MTKDDTLRVALYERDEFGRRLLRIPSLSIEKGMTLLFSGEGELNQGQLGPPWAVIEELEDRVGRIQAFGPAAIERLTFDKIDEHVFRHGRQQHLVYGKSLFWARDLREALAMIGTRLSDCSAFDCNVFDQVEGVLKTHLDKQLPLSGSEEPTPGQYKTQTMILREIPDPGGSGVIARNYEVEPDWYEYNKRLGQLRKRLYESFTRAIVEGRILVAIRSGESATLFPAERVLEYLQAGRDAQFNYLMTRDLPRSWFGSSSAPGSNARRRNVEAAIAVIQALYASQTANGRRPVKGDLLHLLKDKFDISGKAAEDAWRLADIPDWKTRGNHSRKSGISINELRRLIE